MPFEVADISFFKNATTPNAGRFVQNDVREKTPMFSMGFSFGHGNDTNAPTLKMDVPRDNLFLAIYDGGNAACNLFAEPVQAGCQDNGRRKTPVQNEKRRPCFQGRRGDGQLNFSLLPLPPLHAWGELPKRCHQKLC